MKNRADGSSARNKSIDIMNRLSTDKSNSNLESI